MSIVLSSPGNWSRSATRGSSCFSLMKNVLTSMAQTASLGITRLKRQRRRSSLIIWAVICCDGAADLKFCTNNTDTEAYTWTMEHPLLPFLRRIRAKDYVFMQINSSVHTSEGTLDFFERHKIELLPWPALSPDFNPIENIWGCLTQQVYCGGRQFKTKAERKVAILEAWASIPLSLIQSLYRSMQKGATG